MTSTGPAPMVRRVTGRAVDLALWFAIIFVLSAATARTEPDGAQTNPSWVEPLAFVPVFVYEALMLGVWGRTLGKMAAGTKVVTGQGEILGIARASVRAAITWSFTVGLMLSIWEPIWIVGIALFVITFAPAVVRPDRRTLADLAAGTTVERAEPVRSAGPAPGRHRWVRDRRRHDAGPRRHAVLDEACRRTASLTSTDLQAWEPRSRGRFVVPFGRAASPPRREGISGRPSQVAGTGSAGPLPMQLTTASGNDTDDP